MERMNVLRKPADRRAQKLMEKSAVQEETLLLAQLANAKKNADNLARVIDFVNDPLILEDLIYKLKAAQTRFRYFLQKARAGGVSARAFALISSEE